MLDRTDKLIKQTEESTTMKPFYHHCFNNTIIDRQRLQTRICRKRPRAILLSYNKIALIFITKTSKLLKLK